MINEVLQKIFADLVKWWLYKKQQQQQSIHGNLFIVKPLFLLYPVVYNYLYSRGYDLLSCFTSWYF